ncbi:MAG: hypothetical protein IPG00_13020 [Saprospiraceae bacterium]|nr:hypothetical protein [Saprospiraceae bacterium]
MRISRNSWSSMARSYMVLILSCTEKIRTFYSSSMRTLQGDVALCKHYDIDLRKGLFLSGKTGVGKTCHMKLLRQFLSFAERYKMKTCQALALEYMDTGSNVILQYGRNFVEYIDHNTINTSYCFDDLGAEDEVKHYGTKPMFWDRSS